MRVPSATLLSSLLAAGAAALGLSSCLSPFDVNVNTPEPIKVDLAMDVHVYQHGVADQANAVAAASYRAAMDNHRNRMSEVQELKNNRLVGENHDGLLSIRNRPAGEYGDYVEKTVEAENLDREALMRHEAEEKKLDPAKVREEQWRHWQRKSFPGEWIEVVNEDGKTYHWEQKQGITPEGASPAKP